MPATPAPSVLVVDDDLQLRIAVSRALRVAGYAVTIAGNGEEALDVQRQAPSDVLVLDVVMPGVNGLETCRRLRARGDQVPVLMLTARDATQDKVEGLDAGADDYLVKPFDLAELLARLRALLRRADTGEVVGSVLSHAGLTLDVQTREVRRGDRLLELTRLEFSLLEQFLQNPRQVLSRQLLLERVWGYDSETVSNSLEVFVGLLRRKTEADGEPRLLHTVRGVGYVLRAP
jgi:two-component system response regulator MprA